MRLFIAIELPVNYKKALDELKTDIPGARWVPAEQIHLTLAFLGEVAEEMQDRLSAGLARIQTAPFELSMTGTGCFPNSHRPRVLWIGVKPEPLLLDLAAIVHDTVLACGIAQEERPFSPHLTLARLKLPCAKEVSAFLYQHRDIGLKPFPVVEFTLYQSRLSPQGAVHIPIRNFPLGK